MSNVVLKAIEIENYGRFYDSASVHFDGNFSSINIKSGEGKTTFFNALEYLSVAIVDGKINNRWLNYCHTYVNRPKNFVRIEISLEIRDAIHCGIYRYGISVTEVGILSEFLFKEKTGRRIFYRFKNEVDLVGLDEEAVDLVKSNLLVDIPILHILANLNRGIYGYFIRFFSRLWIIRADGMNYRFSADHLFKTSFFARRQNVEKCCDFLRMFDNTVVDLVKVNSTSKVVVIHRNPDGYEYPLALSKESSGFVKCMALFRAIDALSAYGGTIVWDAGEFVFTSINVELFKHTLPDVINLIW